MKRYLSMVVLLAVSWSASAQNDRSSKAKTECTAFPCVVASVSLTDQTSSIFRVPIYTATTSGMFRVSYYEESAQTANSRWEFEWNWTDNSTTRAYGPFTLSPGGVFDSGVPGMWVAAGQSITYSVAPGKGNPGGAGSFSLFATVEQLQ